MAKFGVTIVLSFCVFLLFAAKTGTDLGHRNAIIETSKSVLPANSVDNRIPISALDAIEYSSNPVLKPGHGFDSLADNLPVSQRRNQFYLNGASAPLFSADALHANKQLAFNYPSHNFW